MTKSLICLDVFPTDIIVNTCRVAEYVSPFLFISTFKLLCLVTAQSVYHDHDSKYRCYCDTCLTVKILVLIQSYCRLSAHLSVRTHPPSLARFCTGTLMLESMHSISFDVKKQQRCLQGAMKMEVNQQKNEGMSSNGFVLDQ